MHVNEVHVPDLLQSHLATFHVTPSFPCHVTTLRSHQVIFPPATHFIVRNRLSDGSKSLLAQAFGVDLRNVVVFEVVEAPFA